MPIVTLIGQGNTATNSNSDYLGTDYQLNGDRDRTIPLNIDVGEKVVELNSDLLFNSKESAIKRYLHEPLGVIEGVEVTSIQEEPFPVIVLPGVTYHDYGSITLSDGWINAVFLYINAYDLPTSSGNITSNNYRGSFLVNIDSDISDKIYYSSYTSVFEIGNNNYHNNHTLYFILYLNDDGFLNGKFEFEDPTRIDNVYPGSYIELGTVFTGASISYNDNIQLIYPNIFATDSAPRFTYSPTFFTDYDLQNRLFKGNIINIYEHILPIDTVSLDYIDVNGIEVTSELIISTEGYQLNIYPLFNYDKYIVDVELDYEEFANINCSISTEKLLNGGLINGVDFSFKRGKHFFFLLESYTGIFNLSINVDRVTIFNSISFNIDAEITLSRSNQLVDFSRDVSIDENLEGDIKSVIDLSFSYSGIGRSLDFYFSQNELNKGYLDSRFNNVSFNGLNPLRISHSDENINFYITPINFRGDNKMFFNDNLINGDFIRKGYPLLSYKLIPFNENIPSFSDYILYTFKSDTAFIEKGLGANNDYPQFNSNIETKNIFNKRVLLLKSDTNANNDYEIYTIDEYLDLKDYTFNNKDVYKKYLLIYFKEPIHLIGSNNTSYTSEVKMLKRVL